MDNYPKTLFEAVQFFADNDNCVEFVKSVVWPDGVATCPRCECQDCILLKNQQRWMCRDCRKQFSIKYNTIFEKSPLPLSKWLVAMWLTTSAKNGISSHELSRALGITQKSTWFMLHRIREAMRSGTFRKLSGVVEADESFIGGSEKNRHVTKQKYRRNGRKDDKTVVMGMLERGGEVVAKVVDNQKKPTITGEVRRHVEQGATLYTDALHSYRSLAGEYDHDFTDHRIQYVRGEVHTNTIEGFWSLFKRCVKGTWIHIDMCHTDRYLDEQCFRYNTRKNNDAVRVEVALANVRGRRLTWNELTGKVS